MAKLKPRYFRDYWNLVKVAADRRRKVVILSKHAVQRAGLRFEDDYYETRYEFEPLPEWLERRALEALEKGVVDEDGCVEFRGIRFAFAPVLVTVLRPEKHVADVIVSRTVTNDYNAGE